MIPLMPSMPRPKPTNKDKHTSIPFVSSSSPNSSPEEISLLRRTAGQEALQAEITKLTELLTTVLKAIPMNTPSAPPADSSPLFPPSAAAAAASPAFPADSVDSALPNTQAPARPAAAPSQIPSVSPSMAQSCWADKRSRTSAPVPAARAARMFQPHRDSDGFSFVYLPQKGKRPAHLLRRSLSGLGIPNSRSLLDTLDVHGVTPIKDFDPSTGSNLKDPKYDSLSPAERDSQAIEIHHHRLARIAARCPKHTRRAVGVSFVRSMGLPIELWREHNHPPTTVDYAAIFKADFPPFPFLCRRGYVRDNYSLPSTSSSLPKHGSVLVPNTSSLVTAPLLWPPSHQQPCLSRCFRSGSPILSFVSFLPSLPFASLRVLFLPDLLVHCLYFPPSLPDLEAIAILDSLPAAPSPSFKTIYYGDFNARCMSFGDSRTTTRGTALKLDGHSPSHLS
ncbi:hypothetical protein BD560DRAFT_441477 [Blakeslea trispora]|nr:hypothetical protein BD560DRAFT_441477 [Blakeslea trispora]